MLRPTAETAVVKAAAAALFLPSLSSIARGVASVPVLMGGEIVSPFNVRAAHGPRRCRTHSHVLSPGRSARRSCRMLLLPELHGLRCKDRIWYGRRPRRGDFGYAAACESVWRIMSRQYHAKSQPGAQPSDRIAPRT